MMIERCVQCHYFLLVIIIDLPMFVNFSRDVQVPFFLKTTVAWVFINNLTTSRKQANAFFWYMCTTTKPHMMGGIYIYI